MLLSFFFFNDTATTEIYTLSLHDALPIFNTDYREIHDVIPYREMIYTGPIDEFFDCRYGKLPYRSLEFKFETVHTPRSEEHTSELQSRQYLVCRLLLEKKKNQSLSSINYA